MSLPTSPGFPDRRSLVTWVTVVLIVLGIYWQVSTTAELWSDTGSSLIAAAFWAAYGVLVGWLIYHYQLFERRPVSATIAAVAWGAFVSGGIVALVGPELQSVFDKLLGFETNREWGPALRAPFVEESTKVLGVIALALIPRVNLTRVIDGLYYGMLSGLGFLVSENTFFTNEAVNLGGDGVSTALFETFLTRGLFALPFSHVVYTGIAGAGIGYFVSRPHKSVASRTLVAFGFFALAFFLHGFNNSPVLGDAEFSLFIKGIPALISFLLVLRWARREYRSDLAVVASDLPMIGESELSELASRRSRRHAAKAAEDRDHQQEVQKAQLVLVVAADIYGASSAEVDQAKTVLSAL